MSDMQTTIDHAIALVDSYHSLPHPPELRSLYPLQRELVVTYMNLAQFTKDTYGKKGLSYVRRKYATAREISVAIDSDKGAIKKRPMNQLEVETEALDHVFQARKAEVTAESEWEHLMSTMNAIKQVLMAISIEIRDGSKQQDYENYLEGLQKKEQAQQH